MGFILFLFVVLVGGGWLVGKSIGELLFPDKEGKNTFIDKSVHHHHHHHEHRNISIIDDATKKKIFELKDKN
ncbi:hypothetical protein [Flavobacterium sp. GT3P67]|uniref:hypothetical protein n=1 Tax=Flavobacterium sp. GT3P67 TaxID=2541722 RepID=UPI001053EEEF|nr:hypothetical protein [Flavobacterium sp. GT3P67]TDE53752.1 hypothetical protein E0H99_06980 [Flavobacterium sp. GT3P67]